MAFILGKKYPDENTEHVNIYKGTPYSVLGSWPITYSTGKRSNCPGGVGGPYKISVGEKETPRPIHKKQKCGNAWL